MSEVRAPQLRCEVAPPPLEPAEVSSPKSPANFLRNSWKAMRHTPRAGAGPPDPAGWAWIACGSEIELSSQGQVATKLTDQGWTLATGGSPMMQGRHYWEVQLRTSAACFTFVGASRPRRPLPSSVNLDAAPVAGTALLGGSVRTSHLEESYCIFGADGSLSGNGKVNSDAQGRFSQGDRIGVLLDLDAGWMRFYRNGKRCGPGFTEGVTGPLVPSVQLLNKGDEL